MTKNYDKNVNIRWMIFLQFNEIYFYIQFSEYLSIRYIFTLLRAIFRFTNNFHELRLVCVCMMNVIWMNKKNSNS